MPPCTSRVRVRQDWLICRASKTNRPGLGQGARDPAF